MQPLRASVGYPGNPGPTRNRALAHQRVIDLFADGATEYRTCPRADSFIQRASALPVPTRNDGAWVMASLSQFASQSQTHPRILAACLARALLCCLTLMKEGAGK